MTTVLNLKANEDVLNACYVKLLQIYLNSLEFQEVIDKKEQFMKQAKETEQFFKELNSKKVKFNVIANYFGRGLFTSIDQHLKD